MNSDLVARVERLLGSQALAGPRASTQAARPLVSFRVWCSVTGKPFGVIAERRGETLFLLRNEAPGGAPAARGAAAPLATLGKFGFDDGGWLGCLHCGAKFNERKTLYLVWACDKKSCGYPLHCVGERGGLFRCACGIAADYTFVPAPAIEVRGADANSHPNSGKALGHSATRSLPGAAARLTFRGK